MGANPMLALVQLVRGRAALAEGRHVDAYEQLRRVADPDDVAFHPYVRAWLVADLAEAGVAAGRTDEARRLVDTLGPVAAAAPGGLLVAGLGRARAVLADDDAAEAAYESALAGDTGRFPSHRARLLLAYGTRLRRARRVADSRASLRAARESFDALGFRPWAERARRELRASGETSRARASEAWDRLSPQELQIAQMAARGFTNREIGERLYLSHRTVGSHLYRIFPKLGVTSRAQLRGVLDGAPTRMRRGPPTRSRRAPPTVR
jgi:DNA-binding CsgD family transcriptional regulator